MVADDLQLEPPPPSRYVVGVDLGTTNSAIAYVDTTAQPWQVRVLAIPQFVAAGQVEKRETLPSFHYQPPAAESASGNLRLPWSKAAPAYTVGIYARDQGALAPGRMIASAKSWLCHAGVDRRADILPWHAADDVERLSPVEVSARYLRHIRDAWNATFPNEPLEKQDFVLTLPASFDEVARELTIEAAARAGLVRAVLIEEPQAAFYAWINNHSQTWEQLVASGQKILVCDIGGGTSDFTLIRVRRGEQNKVQFHRVAVGDHLILGGDNLDLALAHHLEDRLSLAAKGESSVSNVHTRQWDALVRICRRVKEELLGASSPETVTVNLPSAGAKLIGGGIQTQVTKDEVQRILVDGFFPLVELDEKPVRRRSGFQEFGLPYAADPAITRHLSAFLTAHRHVADDELLTTPSPEGDTIVRKNDATAPDPARPDIVLFNGGLFESPAIRQRIIHVLEKWFRTTAAPQWSPIVLENDRLDLAVARGAAYYGMVRRGAGVKITANLARSYYIGVESDPPAVVCLVPGNAEPGQEIDLAQHPFELLVSEPVEFPLFISSIRLADRPGEILPVDLEQMKPLPPIRTALKTRRRSESGRVPIVLHSKLTEIGTLDLWCTEVRGERSWRLQFDVRSATQTDLAAHGGAAETQGFLDESLWDAIRQQLFETFDAAGTTSPESLLKNLAAATTLAREDWPPSLLRRIWDQLIEWEAGRRKSATHEARWLNLLGYSLRPGYGMAVDDWRVAETWRLVQGKLLHASANSRTESLILWRRIAGGLSGGQQRAIAEPLLAAIRAQHRKLTTGKERSGDLQLSPHEAVEVWRLLGSLELLPTTVKNELGDIAIDLIPKKKLDQVRPAITWALGRLGARVPVYGPLNTVVPANQASNWLRQLIQGAERDSQTQFAVTQLARRTEDRYRDLGRSYRDEAAAWLQQHDAPSHFSQLVLEGGQLDSEEQTRVFGEALPKGLRIA